MPGSMKDVSNLLASEIGNIIGLNAADGEALTTLFNYVSHGTIADGSEQARLDNVFNALTVVMGRMMVASRPYTGKLQLVESLNSEMFTNRMRKISFASKYPLASGAFNTNLYTNLKDGIDNGSDEGHATASMWEQHRGVPIEMDFSGSSVWQDALTRDLEAIKQAFRGPEEFGQFWGGIMTEKMNDIQLQKEAYRRLCLLASIASRYAMSTSESYTQPGHASMAINLTAGFNAKFGTNYTSAELRTTYLKEFLAYFTAEFKKVSDRMMEKTAFYHYAMSKTIDSNTYYVTRHTPKEKQRAFLYTPLFRDAESLVMPEIFHEGYLERPQGELVEFWQTFSDTDEAAKIDVTTKVFDSDESETAVEIPYVVAFLFDRDAIMTDFQLESAIDTPVEARKRYKSTWWTFARNNIVDPSENGVVFYMADPAGA